MNARCLQSRDISSILHAAFTDENVVLRHQRCQRKGGVDIHLELEAVWDDRYQRRFGFWRPYVVDVIQRYMDCGDLHFGFARVKCED